MNCSNVKARLSAYLDSELTGAEMLAVRSHLNDCPGCATEEQGLRTCKRLLGSLPEIAAPAGLEERLLRAVRTTELRTRPVWKFRLAPLAATVAGLATLLVLTMVRPREEAVQVRSEPAVPTFELTRDQAWATGSDALGVGPVAIPADYARR